MNTKDRLAYGLLALPLALIGLPLYVYLPTLLVQVTGLDLMTVGTLLLTARLVEAICDPLLGRWIARLHQKRSPYLRPISLGVAALLAIFVLLILTSPLWLGISTEPDRHDFWQTSLLRSCVLIAYRSYGWLSIIHYTLGAQWVVQGETATRLYGVRESLALAGVLLGSILPLAVDWTSYGVICAALIAAGVWSLRKSWDVLVTPASTPQGNSAQVKHGQAVDPQIKGVLAVFFISTLAGSLPASLLGFYVADVLGLGDSAPKFLALYFGAGALGFAVWPRLAAKYDATRLWSIAMFAAALAFCFALALREDTPNVAFWFGVVCGATGLLLGAEWMLPQSIVATRLAKLSQSDQAGRVFGIWTWAQKMALAISTGVALWGLAYLGYVPNFKSSNIWALILLYCLIPAVLKMVAAFMAWYLPTYFHRIKK